MRIKTKCMQEVYKPENGQPRILTMHQSTAGHVEKLFDPEESGHFYSTISNPTAETAENKI